MQDINILNFIFFTVVYVINKFVYVYSSFPFAFGQNTSNDVHQQNKCDDTFPQGCKHSRYRSYDGSCNNLQNPTWGSTNATFGRLVRPRYADGK